ncbi:MAG: hypothetical protein J5527_04125 [Treponema sp.]|nr:hypothetical protein [Treponema sp.]
MSAKKWFAGIFSIFLLIAPAFTQNRGEPGQNPPPPEKPADNSQPPQQPVPPKDGVAPDNPPENPQGNPPEKRDHPGPHDNRDFYNFRGYRKIVVSDSIEVVNAYIATSPSSSFFFFRNDNNTEDENEITIRIQFNQSIDPRSMTTEDVLVNEESLPPESQVLFNKNSDVMTIKIIPSDVYKIELNHVTSMDGKVREHITVDNFKQSKAKKN